MEISNTPVFIISYNRLDYLKKLIQWLEKTPCRNIHIIDNNSAYPPLLEYLKTIPYKVHYLQKNMGHMVLWKCGLFNDIIQNQYYVLTDPDILPVEECPTDAITYFHQLLQQYPSYNKAGFSLKIDDIPDSYPRKKEILQWENEYWKHPVKDKNLYRAPIDTTFALYRPGIFPGSKIKKLKWWKGIRTGYPYTARHLSWYINPEQLSEEEKYYMKISNINVATWKLQEVTENKNYYNKIKFLKQRILTLILNFI